MASKTPTPPPNPHFKAGTAVEISSDDPGFRGSWYGGKIVRRASSKTPSKFLVSYTHIFADDAGTKPHTEVFDSSYQLRPQPPPPSEREKESFKFGDEVDAFYNDGWWEGTITKEMGDGRFKVFFRGTREQIVFGKDDLRVHREWVDGVWNPPLDGEEEKRSPDLKPIEEESQEKLGNETPVEKVAITIKEEHGETKKEEIFRQGAVVEVSSDEDGFYGAWFSATIVRAVGKDKFLVQYENLRTEDDTENLKEEIDTQHIRPQPPEKIIVDRFNLFEEVDAWYNDAWWVGVIAKILSNSRYIVFFKDTNEELEFKHSELRLHQEWIDGKWVTMSQTVLL